MSIYLHLIFVINLHQWEFICDGLGYGYVVNMVSDFITFVEAR